MQPTPNGTYTVFCGGCGHKLFWSGAVHQPIQCPKCKANGKIGEETMPLRAGEGDMVGWNCQCPRCLFYHVWQGTWEETIVCAACENKSKWPHTDIPRAVRIKEGNERPSKGYTLVKGNAPSTEQSKHNYQGASIMPFHVPGEGKFQRLYLGAVEKCDLPKKNDEVTITCWWGKGKRIVKVKVNHVGHNSSKEIAGEVIDATRVPYSTR